MLWYRHDDLLKIGDHMKKAIQYAQTLSEEYSHLLEKKKLQVIFKEDKRDNYHSKYAGGTIDLQAKGGAAAVYAVRELIIGEKSGHLAECLGECHPKFALRPLWLKYYAKERVHEICQRMLELGYNALLLESGCEGLEIIHEYGIKIILKWDGNIPKGRFDYLFYEHKHKDIKSKQTQCEQVIAEVKELEKMGKPLIYYLSASDLAQAKRQSEWMNELCDEMGPKTLLAFSCVAGPPSENYLPMHPFWEKLRSTPDVSSTPLLPVFNLGNVGCGEGLWPMVNVKMMEKVFGQMHRHVFAGIMGLVNQMPNRAGLLDCCLWSASRFLWKGESVRRSVDTWCMANQPKMQYNFLFEKLEDLILDLQSLKIEDSKALAESLMARLKEVQVKLEAEEAKRLNKENLTLHDYFVFFEKDARRIVMQFLQKHAPAMMSLYHNDDSADGFWSISQRGGKLTILSEPNKGEPGSKMARIYGDNRIF